MSEQTIEFSLKVRDLLDALQRDIEHIERTISYLNEIRGLVIKRDEQGLGRLLDTIRTEAQEHSANEQNRRLIREDMAELLDCRPEKLTMSVLQRRADGLAKEAVAETQRKLKVMVARLQREYAATVSLICDCSRINSHLLKVIFERGSAGVACYDSSGQMKRRPDAAFMNMRL
jgi:hypothetical protein